MRKFDLSLRSSRSSYFATFRHQLTILSKTDALDEEKWLNMLGTFVKDWFRYESHFSWLPCWSDWSSYYHFNYSGYRWRLLRDGRRWRSPSFSIASWPCY